MTTIRERVVLRKRQAADAAYEAWEQATAEQKSDMWQKYLDAETAYWRAFRAQEGKGTR